MTSSRHGEQNAGWLTVGHVGGGMFHIYDTFPRIEPANILMTHDSEVKWHSVR